MGDISEHFNRAEFACKCGKNCGCDTVDTRLIELLEAIREHFGEPIVINSGHRCPAHNEEIGGSEGSLHMFGRAADIVVKNTDPAKVQEWFDQTWPDQYGMGSYDTFTHVDSRGYKARW